MRRRVSLQRRRRTGLGDKACTNSPRWVRGTVGFLLGALLGGMTGGALAAGVIYSQASLTDPLGDLRITRTMGLVASGITVVGAGAGLIIGAHKPEC